MSTQALSQEALAELKAARDNGDAARYYSILEANGHDYGNLAYQAATKTGFWGIYANNYLMAKAQEYGVVIDRNQIMLDLMKADYDLRSDPARNGLPLTSGDIRDYHWEVFQLNRLPKETWTGTLFDERMGPAVWCLSCNPYELQGQDWISALSGLVNNVSNDWLGTAADFGRFMQTALADGVFSETLVDWNLQATGSITWAGIVKAWTQIPGVVMDGWRKIADLVVDQLPSYNAAAPLLSPAETSFPVTSTDASGVTTQVGTTTSLTFSNGVTLIRLRFADSDLNADVWRIPSADGYREIKTFLNPNPGQTAGWTIDYDSSGNAIRSEYRSVLDGNGLRTDIRDPSDSLIGSRVQRVIDGQSQVDVSFAYDESGSPYITSVNSINGVPPTDPAAAVTALNELGLTPDALATGGFGGVTDTTLEQASGVFATFNAVNPTGSQTLFQALNSGTLIDALSLLRAIQSGDPLPVVSSGLRLAAGLDSLDGKIDSIGLAGAASIAGGALSLLSLKNALDRGDTLAAITSGAQALSFGAQAYANFAGFTGKDALVQAFGADSFVAQIGGNLPYLNLIAAIESGDEVSIGMAALAFTPAAPVAVAYQVYSLVSGLFGGGDDPPPEPWGGASAGWSGFNVVANSYGEHGGESTARSTMTNFIDYLNRLAAYEQSVNPGAAIGVVANRLPSISYRHYSGFELTDIDPLTGAQNYPGIKYDLTGHPYNAPAGSEPAGQTFGERFVRVALARGAIAPRWEVETAALQTRYGDPKAGLTDDCMDAGGRAMPGAIAEEERAGRNGQLAGPLSGDTQTFRPVTLDLDGDGIETTGTTRSVAFDVDDAGFLKNTVWLGNDDAFLFLDRNLNGQIDSGRELFNNGSVAPSARGLAGMRWVDGEADGPGQPWPLAA